MASIGYITAMLADPIVRVVALTAVLTLWGVGLLWGVWRIVSWCRTFVKLVYILHADVGRFNKFLMEENGKKLAQRLYGTRDTNPPTPPFFMRPSSPPPLPTMDASDWGDDDDRPSANTVVKGS
jgi:hypothetical protein